MFTTKDKVHDIKDYKLLPEGAPYQLIEGELIMTPAPNPYHQIISANLFKKLSKFVDENFSGIALYSPIDVYLDNNNVFQPDIVFISKENRNIIKTDGIYGPPEIVVEILSPSTAYYDLRKKMKVYERYGVKEYWIVDPEMKCVEIFAHNNKNEYALILKACDKEIIRSAIIQEFQASAEDIFKI